MTPRNELKDVEPVRAKEGMSSVKAAMMMLAGYRREELDASGFNAEKSSIYDFMNDHMKPYIVNLTGADLDEALYFTYFSCKSLR